MFVKATNMILKVFVAHHKLFQDDLLASLSVVSGLVILAFALCVETFWVLVDVLSAIMGPWANVFHQSGVATLTSALGVQRMALDCLSFDDLGSGCS